MRERKRNGLKRKTFFIRIAAVAVLLGSVLLLSQTAFAENTYVITDGDRVVVHTTKVTDPAAVLNEAGLLLDADDTYTTQAGLGVSEITVQRGQTVTIDNCGEALQVSSQGETVAQLLTRLDISTDSTVCVSAPLDSMTYDGMVLSVSTTVRREEVYTAAIAHGVSYCYDDTIPAGSHEVLTKGVDGQVSRTASVVYENGEEISRVILSETVLQQPVDELVAIGTGGEDVAAGYISQQPIIGDGYIITSTGEVLTFTDTIEVLATAYTHTDAGCDMITAMGTTVRWGTVAVDPKLIPYGTRMFIITNDGSYVYGVATAEDCGGAIKENRVDLYMPTYRECIQFGRKYCTIYILGEAELERNYRGL